MKMAHTIWGIAAALVLMGGVAMAQTANIQRLPNFRDWGSVEVTPAQALSSTTPTAVTGAAIAKATAYDPASTPVAGFTGTVNERVNVTWTVDASKATSGGGTCAVYVNTVLVTRTARTFSPAAWTGRGSLSGSVQLKAADGLTTGTNTVALYCNSSDTAAFTVNAASLTAFELF